MSSDAEALPIAVIGAGLAGLICAQALLQGGPPRCTRFDKARGPSGRMSTAALKTRTALAQCDHGAQYFTARDAAFAPEVAPLAAGRR